MSDLETWSPPGEGWVIVIPEEPMNIGTRRSTRVPRWCGAVGAALLSVASAAWGCSKEVTPGAEPQSGVAKPGVETPTAAAATRPEPNSQQAKSAEPSTAPVESSEGSALAASSKVSEPNFDLSIQPKGDYKAGQAATVEIVLDAKA